MKSSRDPKMKMSLTNCLSTSDSSRRKSYSKNKNLPESMKQYFIKNTKSPKDVLRLVKKAIKTNLQNHNSDRQLFYSKIVNDIIYDERKRIVCVFKDYLLWDENSDFLKRFYYISESKIKLTRFTAYYIKYSVMRPIYFKLDVHKIMNKNVRKHKKYLEVMEENEDKHTEKIEYKEKEFSKLVKTSLISDPILEETRYNYSWSEICVDHFNLTSDYSLFNKIIVDEKPQEIISEKSKLSNKNFQKLNTCEDFIPLKTFKPNLNEIDGKVTMLVPLKENENNKIIKTRNNELQKEECSVQLTNGKTYKKIEFNKLDLKNINLINKQQNEETRSKHYSDRPNNLKSSNKNLIENFNQLIPNNNNVDRVTGNTLNNNENLLNKFVAQTLINTNDIKKKFNIVDKVVRKLKDSQKNYKQIDYNIQNDKKKQDKSKNKNAILNKDSEKYNSQITNNKSKNCSKVISKNNLDNMTNPQSSIYNINLNLNLNLNLNMLNKNPLALSSNKVKIHQDERYPLTDRGGLFNSTVTKFNRLLEKSEKSLDRRKHSRNINTDNYILNYASVTNSSTNKAKNLVIKESSMKGKKLINKENKVNSLNSISKPSTPKLSLTKNNFNIYYKKFTKENEKFMTNVNAENKLAYKTLTNFNSKFNNTPFNEMLISYPVSQRNNKKIISNYIKFDSPNIATNLDSSPYLNTLSSCLANSSLNPHASFNQQKKTTSINLKKSNHNDCFSKFPLSTRNERVTDKI